MSNENKIRILYVQPGKYPEAVSYTHLTLPTNSRV